MDIPSVPKTQFVQNNLTLFLVSVLLPLVVINEYPEYPESIPLFMSCLFLQQLTVNTFLALSWFLDHCFRFRALGLPLFASLTTMVISSLCVMKL